MLRVGLRLFFAALFCSAGIVLVSQWTWFAAGLGVFALGKAVLWAGWALAVRSTERRSGVLLLASLRVLATCNIAAGAMAFLGALSLDRGSIPIVAFGAVCWSWGWGWFLLRSRRWFQASGESSAPDARGRQLQA
jgi:hypothetical protein